MSEQNQPSKYKRTVVAEILKNKKGEGFYVKVKQDIKAGEFLDLQDPRDVVNLLAERGYISAEEQADRLAKIQDFVTRQLVRKTVKDENSSNSK